MPKATASGFVVDALKTTIMVGIGAFILKQAIARTGIGRGLTPHIP